MKTSIPAWLYRSWLAIAEPLSIKLLGGSTTGIKTDASNVISGAPSMFAKFTSAGNSAGKICLCMA